MFPSPPWCHPAASQSPRSLGCPNWGGLERALGWFAVAVSLSLWVSKGTRGCMCLVLCGSVVSPAAVRCPWVKHGLKGPVTMVSQVRKLTADLPWGVGRKSDPRHDCKNPSICPRHGCPGLLLGPHRFAPALHACVAVGSSHRPGGF